MTASERPGDETPLSDRAERETAAKALDRCLVVEASAGTGKTSLIVERVANLIGSGHAGILDVAVITFTEKAASELEERVRSKIDERIEAATVASGTPEGSADELDRYRAARADLDRAAIQTIHGFAASLLRRRPIEAGVDPRFRVLDAQGQEALFEETWDRFVAEEAQPGNTVLETLLVAGIKVTVLRDLAVHFVEHRDLALAGSPGRTPAPDALASAREVCAWMKAKLEAMRASCYDPRDRLWSRLEEACGEAEAIAALSAADAPAAMLGAERLKVSRSLGSESRWHREGLDRAREVRDVWNERILGYSYERAAHLEGEAAAWMARFLRAYEARKAREGVLDFQDLLLRARELLGVRRVAEDLAARYPFVLVDELQDTDPLQLEIVARLASGGVNGDATPPETEGSGHGLGRPRDGSIFLVGDPKQSIYRFRRADPSLYRKATDWLERSTEHPSRLRITDSFRSRPEITAWVNALFVRLFAERSDAADGQYAPLVARRPSSSLPAVLYLVPGARSPARAEGKFSAAAGRIVEASAIATLIRESLLEERWMVATEQDARLRPARGGDVAILLRAFGDVGIYEDALRDEGLTCLTSGGKRYFLRSEVAWFGSLLRAVECPHDEVAVVAALRSPFFGLKDEEIFEARLEGGRLDPLRPERVPDAASQALRTLGEWHRLRNESPVGAAVRRILEESGGLVLAAFRPQGDQIALNLLKIADLARKHESDGGEFRSFVRWVMRASRVELEESDSPVLDAEKDSIQIMTIHAAKGLEFPVVILGDLARRPPSAEKFLVDRDDQKIHFVFKGIASRSRGYEILREREKILQNEERRRLLYVAVTRARDLLVLPVPPDANDDSFAHDLSEGGALPESLWRNGRAADSPIGLGLAGETMILPNGASIHVARMAAVEDAPPGPGPEPVRSIVERTEPAAGTSLLTKSGAEPIGSDGSRAATGQADDEDPGRTERDRHPGEHEGTLDRPLAWGTDRTLGAWERERASLISRASSGPVFLAASRALAPGPEDDLSAALSSRAAISSDVVGPGASVGAGAVSSAGRDRDPGEAPARLANRERAARRARAFGLAVHGVLEDVDLRDPAAVPPLAAAHAALHGCPERTGEVAEAARRALGLRAVREASTRRVLREVPVAFLEREALVEGQIDLVYEAEDGSLVVVDFKTDEVDGVVEVEKRAAEYWTQVSLYAEALERATGRAVRESVLLFLAAGLEVRLIHDGQSRALAAAAIAKAVRARQPAILGPDL